MKPNFEEMSRDALRTYVLEHRDDMEAVRALFHRPSAKRQKMPPMFDKNGQIIEENVRLREESLRQRAEEEHRTRRKIEDEDNRRSE